MSSERKVILYISMSLDGFIAKPNGDLSFLSVVEQEGQDYGYADFLRTVDTVIIGRKSYDKVISMGYDYPVSYRNVYIITRTKRPDNGQLKYFTGSLRTLITDLKKNYGKNIYCDGGSEIVNELLKDNLIDEFYISVIPVILGEGIPLFKNGGPEINLELVSSVKFNKGLVQLHYIR
jgi:dihydrofolate reductase